MTTVNQEAIQNTVRRGDDPLRPEFSCTTRKQVAVESLGALSHRSQKPGTEGDQLPFWNEPEPRRGRRRLTAELAVFDHHATFTG